MNSPAPGELHPTLRVKAASSRKESRLRAALRAEPGLLLKDRRRVQKFVQVLQAPSPCSLIVRSPTGASRALTRRWRDRASSTLDPPAADQVRQLSGGRGRCGGEDHVVLVGDCVHADSKPVPHPFGNSQRRGHGGVGNDYGVVGATI